MICNKGFAAFMPTCLRTIINGNPSGSLILCSGTIPSDSTIAGMTSSSYSAAVVTSAKVATISLAGGRVNIVDNTVQPPQWYLSTSPTTPYASAAAAGTITWAFYYNVSYPEFLVMDVSLPNQGGVIQLDKTVVAVNDIVTLMNISFSMWR